MYTPAKERYETMEYNRCGESGLMLPKVSLGLWHNFGDTSDYENMKQLCFTAFDNGITQFDLANNYGPAYGSAERNFGKILKEELMPYRDELIITTKAGYDMWEGPYGNWGSRKYLLASLDQSLKRMGLEYVDIFYHHRMDPETPLEETMGALATAVQQGKALYVGKTLSQAAAILKDLKCPFVINQNRYSIFDRTVEENGLKRTTGILKKGLITFSPLAQGQLTDRYLNGIPEDSRIRKDGRFLKESALTPERLDQIRRLNDLAVQRGEKLADMALGWLLNHEEVTGVLIGASKPQQILDNATNDANQIRIGAIHYTDDLLSQAESAIGRTLDTYTSKYDSLVNSLQECYDMVRNNRAELDVPPETEQSVQSEYPQDEYPADEYPQNNYEQDAYGQDDYLDDENQYPNDMSVSGYDIQEDDTLD